MVIKRALFFSILQLASTAAILWGSFGCAERAVSSVSDSRLLLNTFCTVTLYDPPDTELISQAFDLCEEYEALLSTTIEGSDIWRVNHAGGEAAAVSPQTVEVIEAGIWFGNISGGLFDISVGRLTALWDFSEDAAVPEPADIDKARETVCFRQVEVTDDSIRISDTGAWLDLGGIAKGYIADRLTDLLVDNGIRTAVVDLGGNVVTIGEKRDGKNWRIGVRAPFGGYSDYFGIIETGAASIVTSGVYERSFESGGELYHHILDPSTGYPVHTDVVSATVVTESSMTGDALSTIFLLVGSEKAVELASKAEGFIGALLIKDNGEYIIIGDIEFEKL